MVSRPMQKSPSSAAANVASASPSIIENRMMSVVVLFLFIHVLTLPFIRAQLITALLKPMEEHTEDARNEEDLSRIPVSPCLS
jgi:hypothetical protein